jgi:phosphoribosylanthranilate isomerase
MTTSRLLKICCLQSLEEAELAISAGADLLGFVADGTGDWGPISPARIAAIVAALPAGSKSVLLTSSTTLDTIIERYREVRPYAVQLTDGFQGDPAALKSGLGAARVFYTVHVTGHDAVETALEASRWADAVMLDSGRPDAKVKVLGATGRPHDWDISAEIVRSVSCPVFLAGGITSENVAAALELVSPAGMDVASGVRECGAFDGAKVGRLSRVLHAGLKGQ